MSDFKFDCIHCGQHMKCDEQFSGREIECPACKQKIVVPYAPGKAPMTAKTGLTFVPDSWKTPPKAGK